MGYEFYKTVHYLSIFTLLTSLVLAIVFYSGEEKSKAKKAMILHGFSWLVLFASAFGLVSAMGLHENFPQWAKAKTTLWVLLGLMPLVIKRKPKMVFVNAAVIFLLAGGAVYLAVYKPF